MKQSLIADIILPVPLMDVFSYRIPLLMEEACLPGMRVIVPFGKRKKMSGLIFQIRPLLTSDRDLKDIEDVLDEKPLLNEVSLLFWKWLSDYYVCPPGDVYKAALPGGLKFESETRLALNPDFVANGTLLGRERDVYELMFEEKTLSIRELEKRLGINYAVPIVKRLEDKKAIHVEEKVSSTFKAKSERVLSLSKDYLNEAELLSLENSLSRAVKQKELLMRFLSLSEDENGQYTKMVTRQKLLGSTSLASALKALLDKNVLSEDVREVSRLTIHRVEDAGLKELVSFQLDALESIKEQFKKKQAVFLHGITSSGKTELYAHLAKEHLDRGEQVLYLVPEIALTTQLTHRLRRYFGNSLAEYHSKLSGNEQVELWKKIANKEGVNIVVGARSAQFLPFTNLGLIIIDEEHETSYKQDQTSPRYQGRDSAIMLGVLHKAKVLLGSATPSMETFHNSVSGKFGYVRLNTRYGDMPLPKMSIIDLGDAYKKRKIKGHFSFELIAAMNETLRDNLQVILFLNRRGYSPIVECKSCGWVLKCPSCDVSLTKHKFNNQMRCHYCGYTSGMPLNCGACESDVILEKGIGTEQLEEEVRKYFPDSSVSRMDFDTTRGKDGFDNLISAFEDGKIDILIGTQMVSKGLDFDNVGLVGIVGADAMLHFSDFRASERSFQMIEQVAGRSGRKGQQGKVFIQTFQPDHPVIKKVVSNMQQAFYDEELLERKMFNYPPFTHIIVVTFRHLFKQNAHDAAMLFAQEMRNYMKGGVLGPEPPVVARIKNQYLERVFIKVDKSKSHDDVKKSILQLSENIKKHDKKFASVGIAIDVDPI